MYEETAEQAAERRRAQAVRRLAEAVLVLALARHTAALGLGSDRQNARRAAEDLA